MNREFLHKIMWEGYYELKAGTTSTYILPSYAEIDVIQDVKQKRQATAEFISMHLKEMLLPIRISFGEIAQVAGTGRGARQRVTQMKSTFTMPEVSPYKIAKPFRVCTSVWQVDGYKCYFFGTIGITMADGEKPKDNGDLAIFSTSDWKKVHIYIFKGLAAPNNEASLQEIVEYIDEREIKG